MNAKERTSLEIYIDELSRSECNALDVERELELLSRASDGDRKAMDTILKANLRFVVSVAKKYAKHGAILEDLVQAGNIALFESFESFDYEKFVRSGCNRFISYAGLRVAQKIMIEAKRHLPFSITDGKYKELRQLQAEIQSLGMESSEESIFLAAKNIGISDKKAKILYDSSLETTSFEQTHEDGKSIENKLGDTSFTTPEDDAILNVSAVELRKSLSKLNRLEEEVLTLAYGLDGHAPMNYPAIGAKIGYTREGVRLIHNRAITHLRDDMGFVA